MDDIYVFNIYLLDRYIPVGVGETRVGGEGGEGGGGLTSLDITEDTDVLAGTPAGVGETCVAEATLRVVTPRRPSTLVGGTTLL